MDGSTIKRQSEQNELNVELELELLYLNINQRLMKDELHYINKNFK